MGPIHIFCNELEVDKDNVFTVKISQENEVENVIFYKNKEYAVTEMTINPFFPKLWPKSCLDILFGYFFHQNSL